MRTYFKEIQQKENRRLAQNGRSVSLWIQIQVLFNNVPAFIGLSFTAIGLPVFFIFLAMLDFSSLKLRGELPVVNGTVIQVNGTNSYSNDILIYGYEYEYNWRGVNYKNVSYTEGKVLDIGAIVNVEFLEDEPELSRIQGMRSNVFEYWIIFVLLPFPLIGLLFLFFAIYKGIRANKLLVYGQVARGRLLRSEPTNTRINNRTVYKLFFEFEAIDGKNYQAVSKTHLPENLEDEEFEKLVYNPEKPEDAVLIDSLPKIVKRYFTEDE